MDINQAARMIEWLDEERRKDKATIATMEERIAQQQETVNSLLKRLNGIESDQSTMRGQFIPSGRDGELIEQARREFQQLLENVEAKRLTAEREAERRSDLAHENLSRPVRELMERVNRMERQQTELPAMQIENDRVAGAIAALQQRVDDLFKKLEEPDRRLAFLEEQRRQDARRISETQSEMPELQKQIDSIRPKIELLEDLALRTERRVQEVQNSERERREQLQQFVDQQNLILHQRDQQINGLVERFGEQDSHMQRNMERFETWSEAYRDMKKIIDDFERIGDRLERRINEVAEMQRLSEERFRQEWNDWSSEDQKRWKQFTLSNDEVWRSHDKEFERFVQEIAETRQKFPPILDSLERIWKMERERARLYRESYQSLLMEYDTGNALSEPARVRTNGTNGTNNGS
jgi:chromosome segregation ATPase